MAYTTNISIRRGNDTTRIFEMQSVGSIAGWTTKLVARTKHTAQDLALELDGFVYRMGSATETGAFGVVVNQAASLALDVRVYVYAFNRIDVGNSYTLADGKLEVKPDVQHALA